MISYDYKVKVCVVGLGPAGIGTTNTLSYSKLASSTLCLDVGKHPSNRSCPVLQNKRCMKCNPCEMISGFGGCSLLGGGKISDFPAGRKIINILGLYDMGRKRLLEGLNFFDNYLALQKPNITSNDIKIASDLFKNLGFDYKYYDAYIYDQEKLRMAYQKLFSQMRSAGMSILLNTELTRIDCEEDGFELVAKRDKESITIFTKYLVLGVGRLGRSMLKSLNAKLDLGGKENHLDVGVRLEFPTDLYLDITKYHNDLKLLFNEARTFCVCKDGRIALYLLEDMFFTEGHYNLNDKSGFTNLGILIRLKRSRRNETIFDEIKQRLRQINNGKPVCMMLADYLGLSANNHDFSKRFDSSLSFWVQGDVNQCFPQPISTKIKEATYYFASRLLPKDRWDEVNIFAPEVDYNGLSFPVNSDFSIIPRLYLIGDCTGRFRGILQAFCSGSICAESIIGGENETSL